MGKGMRERWRLRFEVGIGDLKAVASTTFILASGLCGSLENDEGDYETLKREPPSVPIESLYIERLYHFPLSF